MGLGTSRDPRTEAGLQRSTTPGSPIRTIALLALLSRLVPLVLLHLFPIGTFDASASLLSPPTSSGTPLTPLTTYTPPTLRWDAIHFATIALQGYTFEQQLAFQPGWPLVMRIAGEGVCWARRLFAGLETDDSSLTSNDVVLGGVIAANAAFVGATIMLYKYVKLHTSHSYTTHVSDSPPDSPLPHSQSSRHTCTSSPQLPPCFLPRTPNHSTPCSRSRASSSLLPNDISSRAWCLV